MATTTQQIQALNDAVTQLTTRVNALYDALNQTNQNLAQSNNYACDNIFDLSYTVNKNRTDMDAEDVELHDEIHNLYQNYIPTAQTSLIYTSAFVSAQIDAYLNSRIDNLENRINTLENN